MKFDKANIKKILVVTLSNLGDVILTLPVFQALQETFPSAELHVIVGKGGACVFEGHPYIKKMTVYDKKSSWPEKIALIREVRHQHYDLIVDLKHSLIGLLGGARFHNPYGVFSSSKIHRGLRHLQALKKIVPSPAQEQSFLKIDPRAAISVRDKVGAQAASQGFSAGDFLDGGARLIVAAVGSKSDIKKWPSGHYARLLDRLIAADQCRVVLIGDPSDASTAQAVKKAMRGFAADLTGQTNFQELCALIGSAALLITNDSAPLHIADALKTRCLAIFGPTDPKNTAHVLGTAKLFFAIFFVRLAKKRSAVSGTNA